MCVEQTSPSLSFFVPFDYLLCNVIYYRTDWQQICCMHSSAAFQHGSISVDDCNL